MKSRFYLIYHLPSAILMLVLNSHQRVIAQQPVLQLQDAVTLALENNYDIKIANTDLSMAENEKSILNSGYLPTLTGLAGADYEKNDQDAVFQDGRETSVDGAETTRYNASLNLNYTLFDGLGRYYNYKSLKEQYNLSELQVRNTIENTIVQLSAVYYSVAQAQDNLSALSENLKASKERLKRAEYQFEYGQVNKLEVLNASVDVNNDSISLVQAQQALRNAKRDLKVVIGLTDYDFTAIDTTVVFPVLPAVEELLGRFQENNIELLQLEQNLIISDFQIKAEKSGYLPSIGLTGSYGWNESNFPPTGFLSSNTSVGVAAGINLTWNLFDSGLTIIRVKNARLAENRVRLQKEQRVIELERDFYNLYEDYLNKLQVYQLQQENVATSKDNFLRSSERLKLGQINSIDFRQAQINLLNAEIAVSQAKFQAKLAQLLLFQISGELLNQPLN